MNDLSLSGELPPAWSGILDAYAQYGRIEVDSEVFSGDQMFRDGAAHALEHYLSVGRSAVRLIIEALLLSERFPVRSIMDLPCGGGRVTRHLRACFPDAEIFVAELNKPEEEFVCRQFGAHAIEVAPDFSDKPRTQCDLIFVGSLVTHLDENSFIRATNWFLQALTNEGLLILTTHGRRHDFIERSLHHYIDSPKWDEVQRSVQTTGFGFVATEPSNYGVSWSSMQWLCKTFGQDARYRILMIKEAAWDNHQDVVVFQRRDINE